MVEGNSTQTRVYCGSGLEMAFTCRDVAGIGLGITKQDPVKASEWRNDCSEPLNGKTHLAAGMERDELRGQTKLDSNPARPCTGSVMFIQIP